MEVFIVLLLLFIRYLTDQKRTHAQRLRAQRGYFPIVEIIGTIATAVAGITAGVANAVATKNTTDTQISEANKQRQLDKKMAKMQIAESQRQQQNNMQQQARSSLGDVYRENADLQNRTAAERMQTSDDMRSSLAKAYLGDG